MACLMPPFLTRDMPGTAPSTLLCIISILSSPMYVLSLYVPLLFPILGVEEEEQQRQNSGQRRVLLTNLQPDATGSVGLMHGPALQLEYFNNSAQRQS